MRAVRAIGWAMIWSGGLILAFLGYQLFVTNILTASEQTAASEALDGYFSAERETLVASGADVPPAISADPSDPDQPDPGLQGEPVFYEELPEDVAGVPIAQLIIESADVDHVVVEGVDRSSLRRGPGHMPWTPLPGQPGNAVISGHRTTYGAPFYDLDAVELGDEIVVETVIGRHVYEVRTIVIVEPSAVEVTHWRPGAWLTLTTCHPRLSARQRLVVQAELVSGPNFAFAQTIIQPFEDAAA